MIKSVYKNDACGRKRLRDWQHIPVVMEAGFVGTDRLLSKNVWFIIRIATFLFIGAIGVKYFNPFDGVEAAYLIDTFQIALTISFLLLVLSGEYALRAMTTIWYGRWRSQTIYYRA